MQPTNEKPDKLSERLQSWSVNAKLAPGTADQVWRRIALAETHSTSAFGRMLNRIQYAFSRPAIAGAYVAVLMIIGTVAGSLVGSAKSERRQNELGNRYLASINPYNDNPAITMDRH